MAQIIFLLLVVGVLGHVVAGTGYAVGMARIARGRRA